MATKKDPAAGLKEAVTVYLDRLDSGTDTLGDVDEAKKAMAEAAGYLPPEQREAAEEKRSEAAARAATTRKANAKKATAKKKREAKKAETARAKPETEARTTGQVPRGTWGTPR